MEDENIKDYFGVDNRYVIELQPDDFNDKASWFLKPRGSLKSPVNGMVLFYVPWCGHCSRSKMPFLEAAKASGFCDFYAFNCEKHKNHVNKIRADMPNLIAGYPTIIIYKGGQPGEAYADERTKEAFIASCMKICSDGKCKN